jgi:hypothetical protein
MAILHLAEVDQERLGIHEDVDFTPGQWSLRTVGQLRKQTGYSMERLDAGMDGFPVLLPSGAEVIERDYEAWAAYFWLILWDAGHRIPWTDFDLRTIPQIISDEVSDEGKAEPSDTPSTPTDT